jgi:FAD synthetase
MAKAGLIVIGDEILSGKVVDTNTPFLIGELRALGVTLAEVAVIGDQLELIGETVARFSARYDHVFTSGGVGPTHDDLTIAGVARGFQKSVVRHPELDALLRAYYEYLGKPIIERNLLMADVPDGAELIRGPELKWPVVAMKNVYILPGIPEIFRRKFTAIAERFRDTPFFLRQILIRSEEGVIAAHLDHIAKSHPRVLLGSYPRMEPAADGHRVKLTLEGKDLAAVESAVSELAQLLGESDIVSVV